MTDSTKILGRCPCPVCKTPDQEVRESKGQKAYLMCDECDIQIFARSKRSDRALRGLIQTPAAKEPINAETTPPAAPAKPAVAGPGAPLAARGGILRRA